MLAQSAKDAVEAAPRQPLTRNQKLGLLAAWGGYSLDGMDASIFGLVLVPALRELLPASGMAATEANLGAQGGFLFAMFLIGWGLSACWGPVADRFGRVRTLSLTVLWYALFTALCGFASNVWHLAVLRLLAGIGVGGEYSISSAFISEEWPEQARTRGIGYLNTGFPVGTFLAALANYTIGAHFGWRAMFLFGGLPALLVAFIRYCVKEPERWEKRMQEIGGKLSAREPLFGLFTREYRRRTIVNAVVLMGAMVGYWAGTAYVPATISLLALRNGLSRQRAAELASNAFMVVAIGTIVGHLVCPRVADRLGRKGAGVVYFFLAMVAIAVGFGHVYYMASGALGWFLVCVFVLGIGGGSFTVYTIWVPEQYHTEQRASAMAFALGVGRFVTAAATYLVGGGIKYFGTVGAPIALSSLVLLLAMLVIPFGIETRGKELPA
ncbi:MAG: MFS transporter [Deltaproteobacteria bacterium]|jgi:MFS family permease|nr:MFS transporter [Deltaproteobacteria bacterium]